MKTTEIIVETSKHDLVKIIKSFLPLAKKILKLKSLPKIKLKQQIHSDNGQPTFGAYEHDGVQVIEVNIRERHPVDIIRTLAHELVHYRQGIDGELSAGSWHTGSPAENQAHEIAGVIMREFDRLHPEYLKLQAVE